MKNPETTGGRAGRFKIDMQPLTHQVRVIRYEPGVTDESEVEIALSALMSEGWEWESTAACPPYVIYTLTAKPDEDSYDE